MVIQQIVGNGAVFLLVLLATTASAMLQDEISSPPVAPSRAEASSSPGNPQGDSSYPSDGPSRNTYLYPAGKQYSTYTYSGDRSNQYGSEYADNGFSSHQGDHAIPQYASSFRGFAKMAVSHPYAYYVAHPGEVPGAAYSGARSDNGWQPESRIDDSQGIASRAATIYQSVNPSDSNGASGKRSLLELFSHQDSQPAHSSLISSLTSPDLLNNARVQLSVSGGYPSSAPRYTYLTFIIPGDLCTTTQPGSDLVTSLSQPDRPLQFGNQFSGFANHQQYIQNPVSFGTPPVAGYSTSKLYQYPGTGQSAYGQTFYQSSIPAVGQTFGVNGGGLVGSGGVGTFMNTVTHTAALRSLDDHEQNGGEAKPPSASSAPTSGDTKSNEASRSISA